LRWVGGGAAPIMGERATGGAKVAELSRLEKGRWRTRERRRRRSHGGGRVRKMKVNEFTHSPRRTIGRLFSDRGRP
jgi:hypothetical protein